MALHSIGSGTISFGLVSIPVRLFTAQSSQGVSFNMLHGKCGSRIRQQLFCPSCNETVERSSLVKGYEVQKEQYVRFEESELKALEGEASKAIDIREFVPLSEVDPIYFDKTYYLGPEKGGDKAYQLLAEAMTKSGRVALAQFVMRGKENLVLVRSVKGGLQLHTLYFADEIRDFDQVEKGDPAKVREGEVQLAFRLIEELSRDEFHPEEYRDEHRERVLEAVNKKVEGEEITLTAPEPERAQVIDLMSALKESLAKKVAEGKKPAARASREAPPATKKVRSGKR